MHHQLKHPIGLSPTPVAAPAPTTTAFKGEVIKLPYMGPDKIRDDIIDRPYPTEEFKLKQHTIKEIGEDAQRSEEFEDPCELLIRKVDRIASALKVTTYEAEQLFFKRI